MKLRMLRLELASRLVSDMAFMKNMEIDFASGRFGTRGERPGCLIEDNFIRFAPLSRQERFRRFLVSAIRRMRGA